jgi:PadR family transcriptional regulator PadR
MDPQIKKGILDTIVLAILKNDDTYGYKLSEQIASVIDVAETALYPVLRRLEAQGFLETYSLEHGGRLRKYYHITKSGLDKLKENARELLELERVIAWIKKGVNDHDGKIG